MRRTLPALALLLAGLLLAVPASAATLHRVRPGESLASIAAQYGVTVAALLEANGLLRAITLRPGEVLRIPDPPARAGPIFVRSDPSVLHRAVAAVSPGTGFQVLARQGAWVQVRLPSGQVGWVEQGALERPSPAEPTPPHPAAELRARLAAEALRYVGAPYRWGGATSDGVDCSGLVVLVFRPYAPRLPRVSEDQFRFGRPLRPDEVSAGDLVFFSTDRAGPSHVGIYLGEWRFVHASSAAGRVLVSTLDSPFYARSYLGARRVVP